MNHIFSLHFSWYLDDTYIFLHWNFMYFPESDNLKKSLDHIHRVLFQDIDKQWFSLIQVLKESKVDDSLLFILLDIANVFKSDFDRLTNLFELILIPAVTKCLSQKSSAQAFESFFVMRYLHRKQVKTLEVLRDRWEYFVKDENGIEKNQTPTWILFQLHQSYLNYLNYTETTLIPLLNRLRENITREYVK
jgi:hypothetical protein